MPAEREWNLAARGEMRMPAPFAYFEMASAVRAIRAFGMA